MIWQFFILLKKERAFGMCTVQGIFLEALTYCTFSLILIVLCKVQSQIVAQTKRWHNNSLYRQDCKTLVFRRNSTLYPSQITVQYISSTISKCTLNGFSTRYVIYVIPNGKTARLCHQAPTNIVELLPPMQYVVYFTLKLNLVYCHYLAKSHDMIKYGLFTKQLY